MEELKAMFRVCAHIKKDGIRCNAPAMKGMNFCYQPGSREQVFVHGVVSLITAKGGRRRKPFPER